MRLDDLKGRRLGRYEIIELLGRGGMAAVYRAHDTALRRDVALKVLYPQYGADASLIERFQREAILAARLDHPNIVPIYDVGEADGLIYIAMKLLEGRSLADLLRERRRLTVAELAPILDQIASALDYAHGRGIVHRDIKAANIMLEGATAARQPPGAPLETAFLHARLTDFGIAKSLDAPGMTGTGVLIGTPDYMAPEQISGRPVDGRADIYALGVLAFRALTGRRPYEGGTEEVLLGHMRGDFPDPSLIEPSLPIAIDPVIRQALAREPARRFASAGEFAAAVSHAGGIEPATPPPAVRRPSEGRSVLPGVAAERLADLAGPDALTRHVTVATPRPASMPGAPARRTPVAAPLPPDEAPRAGRAAWVIIALLVVALATGGALLASGQLGGLIAQPTSVVAEPSATNEPVVAPTEIPPAPTGLPTSEPTAVQTQAIASPQATLPPTIAPTVAPSIAPTVAPTVAPTATRQPPSATPTATREPPTATATTAPSPTPCAVVLAGGFGKLWEQNTAVASSLGCGAAAEQGGVQTIAEQQFERGSMFYFKPTEQIYVLFGNGRGTWQVFEQGVLLTYPTPTPALPPATLQGGFGIVWANFPAVAEGLGAPVSPEDGLLEGAYQRFTNGWMLYSSKGLGQGQSIYVLYLDGTFERFDDPNR